MQVLVAEDIGKETMTPVGVTEPVVADTFSDIVMGCDNPGNDTCCTKNTVAIYLLHYMYIKMSNFPQPEHFEDR